MNWMTLTLCGGIIMAGLSLFAYSQDAQHATSNGGGGFESHQVPIYPMLTGATICIFLVCITMAHETSAVLTDLAAAALVLYAVFYFALYRKLQIKRNAISRISSGTEVRAAHFKKNRNDLAGGTAIGTVLLDGKEYRAFFHSDDGGTVPKEGDLLQVGGIDEFYLLVKKPSSENNK